MAATGMSTTGTELMEKIKNLSIFRYTSQKSADAAEDESEFLSEFIRQSHDVLSDYKEHLITITECREEEEKEDRAANQYYGRLFSASYSELEERITNQKAELEALTAEVRTYLLLNEIPCNIYLKEEDDDDPISSYLKKESELEWQPSKVVLPRTTSFKHGITIENMVSPYLNPTDPAIIH